MKPATIHELSKDLENRTNTELIALVLRMAKFKKENKELLTYLLRQSDNETLYVEQLKQEISSQFLLINTSSTYFAKKGLRKVLRYMDRFVRYSGNKESEVDLRIHYCIELKNSDVRMDRSVLITNLYNRQIDKSTKGIAVLHEDLRFDFLQTMKASDL